MRNIVDFKKIHYVAHNNELRPPKSVPLQSWPGTDGQNVLQWYEVLHSLKRYETASLNKKSNQVHIYVAVTSNQ